MSNFPAVHILLGCLTNSKEEDDNVEKTTVNSNRMLCNEYGRLNNCYDIQRILFDYGYKDVFIAHVTLNNYKDLLDSIEYLYLNKSKDSFVLFNLCDGLETDGYPGISILFEIEKRNLYFTGSNSFFYQITTSKPILKKILQSKSIPTSPFIQIDPHDLNKSIDQAENLLSYLNIFSRFWRFHPIPHPNFFII